MSPGSPVPATTRPLGQLPDAHSVPTIYTGIKEVCEDTSLPPPASTFLPIDAVGNGTVNFLLTQTAGSHNKPLNNRDDDNGTMYICTGLDGALKGSYNL